MEQLFEFIGNNTLMVIAFVAVAGMLVFSEIGRFTRGYKEVTTAEAVRLINNKDAAIVDVSNPDYFRKAHIAGAWNLPLDQLKNPGADIEKLKQRPIIVVCKTGNTAHQAAVSLLKQGFSSVSLLRGGMSQWLSDHLPVKTS